MPETDQASCIFCKIISGAISSPRVAEDKDFICIRDIRPQAPKHLLIVPKEHVATLDAAFPEAGRARVDLVGKMFEFGVQVARKEGLLPAGFRSVINTNQHGGQTVFHIHLHLLGGEPLGDAFA